MRKLELFQILPRPRQQWGNALDGKYLLRQHTKNRRLVAAAGADLQRLAEFATGNQYLDHARHDIGLRYGLAEAQRQGGVVVGAICQWLLKKDMTWHKSHGVQYAAIFDTQCAQAFDHARARAL